MGNNNEIRQRMETYRSILLVVNWIGVFAMIVGGLIMISYEVSLGWQGSSFPLRPYGIALLIISILGGISGHLFVNVSLAIPFILLNNGDYLADMASKNKVPIVSNIANTQSINNNNAQGENIHNENDKNIEIEKLEKLFESETDENEKGKIAKILYDLGKTYYWRFIPKEKS